MNGLFVFLLCVGGMTGYVGLMSALGRRLAQTRERVSAPVCSDAMPPYAVRETTQPTRVAS